MEENVLPQTGYLRLPQIIGTLAASPRKQQNPQENRSPQKKERKTQLPFYPPIIPVSKSTWWSGVKSGRYPKPVKTLGTRITAWRAEDIRSLIERS